MKLAVSLRDPAPQNLHTGNLRSEGRWERLVLEALSKSPLVTELYTVRYEWIGGCAVAPNYRGILTPAVSRGVVLLAHDLDTDILNMFDYKGAVITIYAGPREEQLPKLRTLVEKYNDRLIFSRAYPHLMDDKNAKINYSGLDVSFAERLKKMVSPCSIVLLPTPSIPGSRFRDCFDNKILLYASRPVHLSNIHIAWGIKWSLKKLQDDTSLNLMILTGLLKEGEGKGPGDGRAYDIANDGSLIIVDKEINDYFWAHDSVAAYSGVRDRVNLLYSLHWEDVLDLYSKSKLLVNYGISQGGAPFEASMYGVPFIGNNKEAGVLSGCESYLWADSEVGAYSLWDKLLVDKELYTKTASAYNSYATNMYSYASFCNNLFAILSPRGLA